MALNASIFGNMLNAPKSPEEYAAERESLAATRSTNMLNQAKVGEYQAGIKRQGELRNLLAGGADSSALRKSGFLEEAGNWDKNNAAVAKDKAAADEHSFNLAQKRYDTYRKAAASRYNDPNLSKQSVIGDIEQMRGMGVLSPELADHLASQLPDDPMQLREAVKAAAMSQLNGEQLLTAFGPKPEKFDNGGQIITRDMNPNSPTYGQNTGGAPIVKVQSPESRASVAATIRGQDISAATARRGQDLVDGREKEKAAGGGNVTEGERKAGTLLARLRGSQRQLTQALSDDSDAAKPGMASEGLRATFGDTAANLATGQGRQRVEAAQLDMLDAALTLGTGAAYTKEQLRGYARSYFPQIGDDAKTVADKKARLDNVIQSAEIAAGRAAYLVKTPRGATQPSNQGPKAGDVDGGYRFKGGDPSNPSNWEKVK